MNIDPRSLDHPGMRTTVPRALVVFFALASVPSSVWAQGSPLGPEFRVNTYTTDYQLGPSVATDGSGNFVVVWHSGLPFDNEAEVFGQRYTSSGTPLGPEFQINSYTTGLQGGAVVASDAAGNFVVAWQSRAEPPQPPPNPPSLTFVFGQRYASSGAPLGSEFRVNTYTTGDQTSPAMASDAAGNIVVVFDRHDGSFSGVFGQRYASTGAPLGAEFRVNTYTSSDQGFPSVASDSAGNFVVVWESDGQDADGEGIFGQRYASTGAPLGPEFRVNTFITYGQRSASVAASDAGGFVVVWNSYGQDGSDYGIYGQRYASSGAPLGSEFRVNTFVTNYQRDPAVTDDSDGNFVVVWQSLYQDGPPGPGGGGTGVFGQRYTSAGTPSGPEFRVNTYTLGNQDAAAVAADPAGNFVVVWGFTGPFVPEVEVFGQRYGQIVPVELMRFHVE